MKVVYALPKNLGFMISFDPEAQSGVQSPETLLQTRIDVLNHFPIQAGPDFTRNEINAPTVLRAIRRKHLVMSASRACAAAAPLRCDG